MEIKASDLEDVFIDVFEDVESSIDGEIELMTEYRILVRPNSESKKEIERILFKKGL